MGVGFWRKACLCLLRSVAGLRTMKVLAPHIALFQHPNSIYNIHKSQLVHGTTTTNIAERKEESSISF